MPTICGTAEYPKNNRNELLATAAKAAPFISQIGISIKFKIIFKHMVKTIAVVCQACLLQAFNREPTGKSKKAKTKPKTSIFKAGIEEE